MSSTDKKATQNDKKLAKFWSDLLLPAAKKLKRRGAELLDTATSGSSWSKPPSDVPELSELSPAALADHLQARLEAEGLSELAEIVPNMMELADELRPSAQTDEEVNPFVYVMH
ncbi:MAG TPA: hypothetical protein EYG54_04695 [Myxococcales bacterium]|nr:hypothetical protein [Myxococcales bacterium]